MARTDPRPHYGRKRRVRVDGYVDVWRLGHPLARRDGYVYEHRLVLYEAGLTVPPGFHVHDINGDRSDNRLENLAVLTAAAHGRHHSPNTGKTHCANGHEFTEANTWVNPKTGWRGCRACNRERQRERKRRLRGVP